MLYYIILILSAASISLLVYGLFLFKEQPRFSLFPQDNIIKSAVEYPKAGLNMPQRVSKPGIVDFITKPFYKLTYLKNLQDQAEMLRVPFNLATVILIKLIAALALFMLSFILLSPIYAPILLIVGFFVPDYIFIAKIRAKKEAIVRIFPETIDLMDMCISAGADFLSAIKWVIEKSNYNPFIDQLRILLNEIKVGKPRTEALKDMSRRLKIPEVSSFVRSVILAERMGTSIEDAFRNLSEDTRNMRFQAGERYAIKASLKILFPLLFCILPTILIVVAGPILIKFMQGEMGGGAMGF